MPPVTTMTSRPSACSTGQPRPSGPRTRQRVDQARARRSAPSPHRLPESSARIRRRGSATRRSAGRRRRAATPSRTARAGRPAEPGSSCAGAASWCRRSRGAWPRRLRAFRGDAVRPQTTALAAPVVGASDRFNRRRDRHELLADVDADRAPRDAPTAANAAERAELGRPRRRTCASATGGSGPRRAVRKLPPATRAKSSVKQESQVRSVEADSPSRSLRWLTLVQKHVGHTSVQFVHARQRSAICCPARALRCGRQGARAVRRSSSDLWHLLAHAGDRRLRGGELGVRRWLPEGARRRPTARAVSQHAPRSRHRARTARGQSHS